MCSADAVSGDARPGPAALGPGAAIGGYRIEQRIGRGGMAVVYRARDERLHRLVALKVLAPGLTRDHAFRARFIRESQAAAAVDHPNVLPVYEAGESAGHLFIAMRFVSGGDVRSYLRTAGPLAPDQAWDIIAQAAAALDAAHQRGLVHRDVKPGNMLLEADPARNRHVYLADFGVSKQVLAEQLTTTGQIVGTPDYIAPEQIEGQPLDGRADQYALACTTFELLSGVPPFRRGQSHAIIYAQLYEQPPALSSRRPGLPGAVDEVLARALAKSAADRYATCAQFARRLRTALGLADREAGGPPIVPPAAATRQWQQPEPPTRKRES